MDQDTNVAKLDDYRKTPRKITQEEQRELKDWIESDQLRARTAREEADRLHKFMAEFERRCRDGDKSIM